MYANMLGPHGGGGRGSGSGSGPDVTGAPHPGPSAGGWPQALLPTSFLAYPFMQNIDPQYDLVVGAGFAAQFGSRVQVSKVDLVNCIFGYFSILLMVSDSDSLVLCVDTHLYVSVFVFSGL